MASTNSFCIFNLNKHILHMKQILTALLIMLAYYGIFSFITWDFDISEWSWGDRLFYTIFTFWAISKINDK